MSVQELKRVVSSNGLLTVDQLQAGDINYNYTGGTLQLVAQSSSGAKVLVPIATGTAAPPGQVNTNSTFLAGSAITAGQFLAVDSTNPNQLVPCSFPGQAAIGVARANAAPAALVDVCLFGPISAKAGANFAIGAVLKTNLSAEAVAATALNLGVSPAVNGSNVLGYALSPGVAGQPVNIMFVGGSTMLPTNPQ